MVCSYHRSFLSNTVEVAGAGTQLWWPQKKARQSKHLLATFSHLFPLVWGHSPFRLLAWLWRSQPGAVAIRKSCRSDGEGQELQQFPHCRCSPTTQLDSSSWLVPYWFTCPIPSCNIISLAPITPDKESKKYHENVKKSSISTINFMLAATVLVYWTLSPVSLTSFDRKIEVVNKSILA